METPRDLGPYKTAWHQRFAFAEDARVTRGRAAAAILPTLVRHLVSRYGVRRIWLFGSLEEGGFHERSDIDIAVEGLPPGAALFRAAAELDDLPTPFAVDLVPIEDARPAVRQHILTRARLLYDRVSPT